MRISVWTRASAMFAWALMGSIQLEAATIVVAAGGDLQAAINAAKPGDTIQLAAGAEFVGSFVLPPKSGDSYIVIRSATPDSLLPGPGRRIRPTDAPLLARLRSPSDAPALRTEPGAHHWRLQYLEFAANKGGLNDIIRLGDGSSLQSSLAAVPHHFVLEHLYIHGDPLLGQKRGIAANVAHLEIRDSYIADMKGVGQDTQAICVWNGPGPFTIENNYLEAAGENVLFGGSDPSILNLVPSDIVIRHNVFSRPMSWMQPIVPVPQGVTAAAESGGTLPAGTYAYQVVARRPVSQGTVARSTASAPVTVTLDLPGGSTGTVRIRWDRVPDATEYRVYGRAPSGGSMYWTVTGTEFVDTGGGGASESVPKTAGTTWTVKNLLELKNARNVLIEGNIFENHWKQAQAGYAIVYTPRNSGGACTWCVVEHINFQLNLVRNVAAGINVLGYDNTDPSAQANNLIFRQNLFQDLRKSLGGNAWFMLIGDEPRDITIDHNTIDSDGSTVVNVYGGSSADPREVYGFRMTNNAARHGSYGMGGSYFSYGNGILNGFYPGHVFSANYLAGASSSRYPAGTLVAGPFEDQFGDHSAGDYTVRSQSLLYRAATDGTDVGVDVGALTAAVLGVEEGVTTPPPPLALPAPAFSWSCNGLTCSFTDNSADPDGAISSWRWDFGDGSTSTLENPTHTFASAGTHTVTLVVTDNDGQTTATSRTLSLEAPNQAPVAAFTVSCTNLTCAFTDGSSDPDGSVSGWSWSFGNGITSAQRNPAITFAAAGTYTVDLVVVDDDGASSESARRTVTVTAANLAPVASFTYVCSGVSCVFTDTSTDGDGAIVKWLWNFGDGSSSSEQSPTRVFAAPGTYGVTMTVTDDAGAAATQTRSVTVAATGVHAGNLTGSRNLTKSNWTATVMVEVHHAGEGAVQGAKVLFKWGGGLRGTTSCTTDSRGLCSVTSTGIKLKENFVKLAITSIQSSAGAYLAAANHDPDGSSNGTEVRIDR